MVPGGSRVLLASVCQSIFLVEGGEGGVGIFIRGEFISGILICRRGGFYLVFGEFPGVDFI